MPINIGRFAQRERREDTYTPSNGQTIFTLTATPTDITDVDVYVNNVKYEQLTNYTVLSNAVTWLDTPFTMQTTDAVEIIYFV